MITRLTTEQFIEKAKLTHGNKYDFSLVNYINLNTKVKIICPIHGVFEIAPKHFIHSKAECRKCGRLKASLHKRITTKEFIELSRLVHGNYYDYSITEYITGETKVKIICPKHGVFKQLPYHHFKRGCGCPKCKRSHGETVIENYLIEHNINYKPQKRFADCKGKRNSLPFDFYLPEVNTCIEYDGEQHFKPYRFSQDIKYIKKLETIKKHDQIKTNYCKDNDIRLIRIPYTIKNIQQVLINII